MMNFKNSIIYNYEDFKTISNLSIGCIKHGS
jgi:hypothetical protein